MRENVKQLVVLSGIRLDTERNHGERWSGTSNEHFRGDEMKSRSESRRREESKRIFR